MIAHILSSTCTSNETQFYIIIYCSRLFNVLCSSSNHFCIATGKPSINSFRCRSSLLNDIFSKTNLVTWLYGKHKKKLIWSYGEFSNPLRGLMKTKKANAICIKALEKFNHFSNLYATTTLHFNVWTRMEFPSSDACLEDFRLLRIKKKTPLKLLDSYIHGHLSCFLRLLILIAWRTQRGTN